MDNSPDAVCRTRTLRCYVSVPWESVKISFYAHFIRLDVAHCGADADVPADYTGFLNSAGQLHGRGSCVVVEGDGKGNKHKGTFVNVLRDGFGVETLKDGSTYKGQFKNDLRSSFDKVFMSVLSSISCIKYTFSDGRVYEGQFRDGKATGLPKVCVDKSIVD
jgi:hypothetical protein